MAEYDDTPHEDDLRHDDQDYNPSIEPEKAFAWLNLLEESEDAFEQWNEHCDVIEKKFANIERLANAARTREMQLFWASMEVTRPAIYAKAPQPVVVTKFKDRRPVPNAAADMLERCIVVAFDLAHIDEVMRQLRDNLALTGRGVPWCRYEKGGRGGFYNKWEKVCIDYKQRRDFLHSISRTWEEVWWVAGAAYMTRSEARARFHKHSGDEYQQAEYSVDKDAKEVGGADDRERCKVWEIWDKKRRRVVWVAKGCEEILDAEDAEKVADLLNFFPCPKPAYGSLQPGSLIPVPDQLQSRDQIDEINLLTAKIHALSIAIEAKGFYPAGGGEMADAIDAAIKTNTPGRLLIPIANWAGFGGTKEVIIWLPIAEIAQTVQSLVELRKQVVQDYYEVTGISDIMRGATDPRETMGAQQMKTEYGSVRVRDKQAELVRVARDLVGITSDIICEKFDEVTLIQMSQTALPTTRMQEEILAPMIEQVNQQRAQLQQAQVMLQQQQQQAQLGPPPGMPTGAPPPPAPVGAASPPPQGGGDPAAMQQMLQQAEDMIALQESEIENIRSRPTFNQVVKFLRDMRSRAFVLDIETDSTIAVDEAAEKQRRTEFMGMLAQLLPQLTQMVQGEPATAHFAGETLKFSVAPFRGGRAMDGAIDSFVALMEDKVNQPRGDDPTTAAGKIQLQIAQMEDATTKQKNAADQALRQQELQMKDATQRAKIASTEKVQMAKVRENATDEISEAMKVKADMIARREEHRLKLIEGANKIEQGRQKIQQQAVAAQFRQQDAQAKQSERRAEHAFRLSMPPREGGGGRPM